MNRNNDDEEFILRLASRPTNRRILLHLLQVGKDFGYNMARVMFLRSPTIYEHLGHLLEAGLVERFEMETTSSSQHGQKVFYRLTSFGEEIVSAIE